MLLLLCTTETELTFENKTKCNSCEKFKIIFHKS